MRRPAVRLELVNWTVGDEFGVLMAECFRDVAVPADRPVRGQSLLKVFDRNFVPLNSLALDVN